MIVAWLLFPLVLLAVCTGCGLAVERVAGWRLPGALLPSAGLALVIVVASLTTSRELTAPLTTPLIIVLTIGGYAASLKRARALRPEPWALAVGLAIFAVCAAPVVLSGNATFLGYFVLNDASFHFALVDQLLAHGHDLTRLSPSSSYFAVLHSYLATSYPVGADVALGGIRPLVGQDVAWIFQPYLAVILALGGVAVHQLLEGVVRSRPLRAASAFVAAQAALVYAYYLQGSIKELATTWLITVTVVLVFATPTVKFRLRNVVPLLVVTVAGFDVLGIAIAPWLGPPVAVFVILAAWRARHAVRAASGRRLALATAGSAVILVALTAPIIGGASNFFNVASAVLTQQGDLGNLFSPLPKWQMVGIWPAGDFRAGVGAHYKLTYVLIGVAIVSALIGWLSTVRRRAHGPLLLVTGNAIAAGYLLTRASPYATAKVMMIFSLTVVLAAMLGAAALHESGRRLEGWGLATAIAAGVLWSTALGYHDASVAPRDRLAELSAINSRFSGGGPAFYNLSDEFAIHFLRDLAPADPALGLPTLRPGVVQVIGREPWDPDALAPSYLQSFRLLVLDRSPRFSRPPSDYQLAFQGRYYDVWRRTSTPQVLEHMPIGTPLLPEAVPRCRAVLTTARRATREHARLAYVARAAIPVIVPALVTRPPNWGLVSGDPYSLIMRQDPGAVTGTIRVARAGTYQVWLQGSFSQRLPIWIDNHQIGSVAYELGPPGQTVRVGTMTVTAGEHAVKILRPGNDLTPGDGGEQRLLGPLMLVSDSTPPPVSEIDPGQARSLCGRTLDWLEVVR